MFNGNFDVLVSNDNAGFATQLLPGLITRSPPAFSGATDDESDIEFDDVNMHDFIDIANAEPDVEELESASSIMSPQSELCDSFSSLDARAHDSGVLNHLDRHRGLVGSFRHNQNFAKHVSSLASHPAKRASTHEANALQKGRRAAANTPMTPARKKRISQDLTTTGAGIKKAISSPLAGKRPRSRGGSASGNLNQTLGQAFM
jgi:hypothetical protein